VPDLEHGRGFGRVHGGGSGPSLGRQPLALYNNSVPPLIAHDPLGAAAVAGQPHWAVLLVATLHVAGEPWALALLALAAYSWLEREVRGVVEVVVPLALALALGGAGVEVARIAAAAPRPAGAAGLAPLVRHLFPGPHVLALAAFAGYSLLVYRRRAVAPLVLAALAALGAAGRYGGGALVAGITAGLALASLAYALAVRLARRGVLAARFRGRGSADAGPPAA